MAYLPVMSRGFTGHRPPRSEGILLQRSKYGLKNIHSINKALCAESEIQMILKIYAVRDAKAAVFNTPFYQVTHGSAERYFMELLRDERSFLSKYPDDFDLYHLGTYDDATGTITPIVPEHIVKGVQLVQQLKEATLAKGPQISSVSNQQSLM